MKPILAASVYLRELTVADVSDKYIEGLNDLDVVGFTEARHRRWDRQGLVAYVNDSNAEGVSQLIGVFLNGSDQHIGNVRLSGLSKHHRRVDLGIMIFDKTQWGKGYGTKAVVAATEYAFNVLNLHKVCADYYSSNQASARMFAKAYYEVEGVFRDHFVLNGEFVDSVRVARFAR